MAWNFKSDRPIYIQIADLIKRDIFSGKYAPGDRIPGVRDLAMMASVNPNTIPHAMNLLEEEGLLVTPSTAGRFVTSDAEVLGRLRESFAEGFCIELVLALRAIGLDDRQISVAVGRALEQFAEKQ